VPHAPQNFMPGAFDAPHTGQDPARDVPHSPQNFRSSSLAVPHDGQFTLISSVAAASISGHAIAVNATTRKGHHLPMLASHRRRCRLLD
jgi:hypothetical protein